MRATLVTLAAFGVASANASFLYPDTVPLHRRQAPGTPEYDCHANCGGVIVDSRTENFCTNATFTGHLDACLDCALKYDIWQYYGTKVSAAAEQCGVDGTPRAATTPSASSSSVAPTSTAAPETSAPAVETTPAASTGIATTDPAAPSTASATGGAAAPTTLKATTSAIQGTSQTSSGASAVATYQGAASKFVLSGVLAAIPLGAMAAALA